MRTLPSIFFSSHHASTMTDLGHFETSGPFKSFFCIPNLAELYISRNANQEVTSTWAGTFYSE